MKKYLLGKIVKFIKRWDMLSGGEGVLLAVSGGADSIFMTEIFFDLARIFNLRFECVHVNHGLRGKESDSDEEFVRTYCKEKGVFLTVERLENLNLSDSGIEAKARKGRYRVFYEVLKKRGLDYVATAHTLDDSVETVIFNMLRGSGIPGIAGIPPVSGKVIRPILSVERKEILEYLSKMGISYVVDSTNREEKYTRNYIRNKILPLFEAVNPDYRKHVFHTSLITRDMEEWSRKKVEELKSAMLHNSEFAHVYKIPCTSFPDVVYVDLLKLYVPSPSYEEVSQFLSLIHIQSGRMALRDIEISFGSGELAFLFGNYAIKENVSIEDTVFRNDIMNYVIRITKGVARGKMECQIDKSYLPFVVRTRREGDRINGKKLKDRFIDLKIPYWRRRFWPVFEKNGEIFFVPGVFKKEVKNGDLKLEVKKYDPERFSIFD